MGRKYDEHSLNRPNTLVHLFYSQFTPLKTRSFTQGIFGCLTICICTQFVWDLKVLRGYRYATFGEPEPKISHANFFIWNNYQVGSRPRWKHTSAVYVHMEGIRKELCGIMN